MATATKTPLENITSRYFNYFAIIPIRSTCTMWPINPAEKVGAALKLRQRMKTLSSFAHVLQKILNLVISRRCLPEDGEEMYQNS